MTEDLGIRTYRDNDLESLVELGLRAWQPVFESWSEILGDRLYDLAYPDWRSKQASQIRRTCLDSAARTLVAEIGGLVAGFAVVTVQADRPLGTATGEVEMIAVHPAAQRSGAGRRLMEEALEIMRGAGCALARIGTGGDEGHAPARSLYESCNGKCTSFSKEVTDGYEHERDETPSRAERTAWPQSPICRVPSVRTDRSR